MKKTFLLGLVATVLCAFLPEFEELQIGEIAPMTDRMMKDISGSELSLSDAAGENGLLVIFSCNTCPFVIAWEDRYRELAARTADLSVGMVLVNSNTKKRGNEDSMEAMVAHAAEKGYDCSYVIDQQNELADAFGARTTPHVFLFDAEMKLIYKGSIDDQYENKDRVATRFYLNNAIEAAARNEKPDPAETRQIGCSIKRG
jgi:hypothetical protein